MKSHCNFFFRRVQGDSSLWKYSGHLFITNFRTPIKWKLDTKYGKHSQFFIWFLDMSSCRFAPINSYSLCPSSLGLSVSLALYSSLSLSINLSIYPKSYYVLVNLPVSIIVSIGSSLSLTSPPRNRSLSLSLCNYFVI